MLDAPTCPCCGDLIAPSPAFPEPPYGHEPMTNTYECDCGTTWDDDWCCACDDECPSCGTDVEPSISTPWNEEAA